VAVERPSNRNRMGDVYKRPSSNAAYCGDGAEVCPPDAAAAEETAGEDEGADGVERDADRVDGNVDEAGIDGRLGRHDDAEGDQRQTRKLYTSDNATVSVG